MCHVGFRTIQLNWFETQGRQAVILTIKRSNSSSWRAIIWLTVSSSGTSSSSWNVSKFPHLTNWSIHNVVVGAIGLFLSNAVHYLRFDLATHRKIGLVVSVHLLVDRYPGGRSSPSKLATLLTVLNSDAKDWAGAATELPLSPLKVAPPSRSWGTGLRQCGESLRCHCRCPCCIWSVDR